MSGPWEEYQKRGVEFNYSDTGQPVLPDQAATYRQLMATGGIDLKAQPGTIRLPTANRSDIVGQPVAGQWYVDIDGAVKQAPAAPGRPPATPASPQKMMVVEDFDSTGFKTGEHLEPDPGRSKDGWGDYRRDVGKVAGALNQTVRSLGEGVPGVGSWLGEANAATNALLAPAVEPLLNLNPLHDRSNNLSGPGTTWKDRFDRSLAMEDATDLERRTNHPKANLAGNLVGGIAATVATMGAVKPGPGLLGNMAKGGVAGGGIGLVQGAGNGQTMEERGQNALETGALGAGLGAAIPGGMALVGEIGKKTLVPLADALRGKVTLAPPVAPGVEPAALAAALSGAGKGGSSTIVQVKPSQMNQAYGKINESLERMDLTPDQAVSQVRQLGPKGVLADVGGPVHTLARAATNTPSRAENIAQQVLGARQKGVLADGEFLLSPAAVRVTDAAAEGMGVTGRKYLDEIEAITAAQKEVAGPAYRRAYSAPPVPRETLKAFEGETLEGAYARARAISQREFVKLPDGSDAIVPLPSTMPPQLDWRTLDLMKQGVDDLVREGSTSGIGANMLGATKGYAKRFRSTLDDLNPDYKKARDEFADAASLKDAAEMGRKFFAEDPDVTSRVLADMTKAEAEMFRVGWLQSFKTKMGNKRLNFDASSDNLTPNQLSRFKTLFPDQTSFARFANTLTNEDAMFATNRAISGNSTTVKQALAAEDAAQDPLATAAKTAIDIKSGGIAGLIQGLLKSDRTKLDEGTANALAGALFNQGDGYLDEAAAGLQAARERGAMASGLRGLGSASGFGGGMNTDPLKRSKVPVQASGRLAGGRGVYMDGEGNLRFVGTGELVP